MKVIRRGIALFAVVAVSGALQAGVVSASPSPVTATLVAQTASDDAGDSDARSSGSDGGERSQGSDGGEPSSGPPPAGDELVDELQSLLSHHATLAIRFTRATLSDDPGFVEAADDALVRNTADLEEALRPAIGADRAERFGEQWQRQTQALFQCAVALRDDETATKQEAQRQLDRYVEDQSSLLAQVSDGRLDRSGVADALETYVERQVAQVEHFSEGDFGRAYELQRTAYDQMFPLGRTVGQAAGPLPAPSPADELQTALAKLLGEHVELAIDAMRAGVEGADDFEAAAGALDANTRDVTDAMDALFGPRRAQQFNEVWADHIDLFVDYTVAVADGDEATKREVRGQFDTVMEQFGTTLATATGGLVDAEVVTEAMGQHEQQLIDQIEQYAEGDFGAASEVSYTAYQHIRHVADVLAGAFAEAVQQDLPQGGADTGGGGTAAR